MTALVAVMSSAENARPCAAGSSVWVGDGKPMWLRSTMSDGASVTALARFRAASRASRSLATSPISSTCQP